MELFIPPNQNISDYSSREWQHFANLSRDEIRQRWTSSIGKGLFNNIEAGRFLRDTLKKHVGLFDGRYDLRGIPLSDIKLSGFDLSGIDFFYADLSNSSFDKCNFSNSHLSECDISDSCFDWTILNNTLLDNIKFSNKTSLLGIDLKSVNFTLANLLHDLALSQQRIQQLKQHYPFFAVFLRISSDYGRSFFRYTFWVILLIFGYASAYMVSMHKPFIDCLYFSVATFTTVGYGDIIPATVLQKILVMSEMIIGYLMGGLLVGILAKRVID